MFIIPFTHSTKIENKIKLNIISILTIGGQDLWEECNMEMEEDTVCYTYKVEMIIHLLSDSEPKAAEQLEKNGGYVSSRNVTLIDSVPLIKG